MKNYFFFFSGKMKQELYNKTISKFGVGKIKIFKILMNYFQKELRSNLYST